MQSIRSTGVTLIPITDTKATTATTIKMSTSTRTTEAMVDGSQELSQGNGQKRDAIQSSYTVVNHVIIVESLNSHAIRSTHMDAIHIRTELCKALQLNLLWTVIFLMQQGAVLYDLIFNHLSF